MSGQPERRQLVTHLGLPVHGRFERLMQYEREPRQACIAKRLCFMSGAHGAYVQSVMEARSIRLTTMSQVANLVSYSWLKYA